MNLYPIILWSVFLSTISVAFGLNLLIYKNASPIYKALYERKNLHTYAEELGPRILTYIPQSKRMELANKLMYAGYPYGLNVETFIGIQLLLCIITLAIGLLLTSFGFPSFFVLIMIFIVFLVPISLLNEKVKKKQLEIKKSLPAMVGLLSTAVSAGVELGPAFTLISNNIPGALGDELRRAMKEIKTGTKRSVAFRRMANRVGVDILDRFVETINTAEERGAMQIGYVLEDFADDVRTMQKLDMEEKAQKLPTKLLLPIVLCIFLPMLVILVTPVVFTLLKTI